MVHESEDLKEMEEFNYLTLFNYLIICGTLNVGLNIKQYNITNNCPVLIFPTHLLMVTAGEGYSAKWILRHPLHYMHICAHRFME